MAISARCYLHRVTGGLSAGLPTIKRAGCEVFFYWLSTSLKHASQKCCARISTEARPNFHRWSGVAPQRLHSIDRALYTRSLICNMRKPRAVLGGFCASLLSDYRAHRKNIERILIEKPPANTVDRSPLCFDYLHSVRIGHALFFARFMH